jgi:serine/threonine-protein kinase HipA
MQREEARRARAANTTPRSLLEIDYLLMVRDEARPGALRFSWAEGGPFLTADAQGLPPLIELGRLMEAARKIEARQELDQDIRDLFAPGASLGGARPKASIRGTDGKLRIAKFESTRDEWDVELWEYVAFKIAHAAGIRAPAVEYTTVGGKSVLLLDRFDRGEGNQRIPYLSAMSMLNYNDGEHGSYLEIAEALAEHGARAAEDQKELWTRMVLNILISNYDDHLRNHGFLYEGTNGWRLSPVFDLEPTPIAAGKDRRLHTYIGLYDTEASLDEALSVADEFGLSLDDAREIAKTVGIASDSNWRRWASQKGAKAEEIAMMATAFEHKDLKLALSPGKVHAVVAKIKTTGQAPPDTVSDPHKT